MKQNISMTHYSRGKRTFEDSKGLIRKCTENTIDKSKQETDRKNNGQKDKPGSTKH